MPKCGCGCGVDCARTFVHGHNGAKSDQERIFSKIEKGDTMDHDRSHYAIQDRPEVLRPAALTAGQLAELRAMVASKLKIPVIEKSVLAALLDAYEAASVLRRTLETHAVRLMGPRSPFWQCTYCQALQTSPIRFPHRPDCLVAAG